MVGLVNYYLGGALDGIDAWGGNKIARIDAFGFIGGVVAAPASFGFTNVTGAFMTLDLGSGTVSYAAPKQNAAKDWFFWDDLHPTTRGHKYFARNAMVTLRAAFPGAIPDCRDED
jgi:outer membrane lipase/esterase